MPLINAPLFPRRLRILVCKCEKYEAKKEKREREKLSHNRRDDVLYIYLCLVCKRKTKQRLRCATDGAHQRISLSFSVFLFILLPFFTKRPWSWSWLLSWLSWWWNRCSNGEVCFFYRSSFHCCSSRETSEARTIPSFDGLEMRRLVFEIRIEFFLARRKTRNLSRGRSQFGTPTSPRCTDARRLE